MQLNMHIRLGGDSWESVFDLTTWFHADSIYSLLILIIPSISYLPTMGSTNESLFNSE